MKKIIFMFIILSLVLSGCSNSEKNSTSKFNGLEKIDDSIHHFVYVDDGGGIWYGNKNTFEVTKLKNDLSFEKKYKIPGATEIGLLKDGKIWVFQNYLLAKSEDNGETWECFTKENYVNCDTTRQEYSFNLISSIISEIDSIFIGTYDGIYRSKDQGASWERVYFDEKDPSLNHIFDIASHNGVLYASAILNVDNPASNIAYGVLESLDNGDTWERSLVNKSTFYFAGGYNDNVYAYTRDYNSLMFTFWTKNSNENWRLTSYLPDIKDEGKGTCDFKFTTLKNGEIVGSCSLLVSEYRGGDFPSVDYLGAYLIRSHDNGNSWKTIELDNKIKYIFSLKVLNSGDILLSTDKGIFKMSLSSIN
ncbi:MAG: hypothetical protein AABX32_02490 [Nanoarchaeota archaeon]